MRRDMELVRRILIDLGDSDYPLDADAIAGGRYAYEDVAYHMDIMCDAGLIRADIGKRTDGRIDNATAISLTWEGNDYLDAVVNDKVWARVKSTIAKRAGAATFDVVKALATQELSALLMQ